MIRARRFPIASRWKSLPELQAILVMSDVPESVASMSGQRSCFSCFSPVPSNFRCQSMINCAGAAPQSAPSVQEIRRHDNCGERKKEDGQFFVSTFDCLSAAYSLITHLETMIIVQSSLSGR